MENHISIWFKPRRMLWRVVKHNLVRGIAQIGSTAHHAFLKCLTCP